MPPELNSEMDQEPLSDIQKLIRLKRYESPPEGAVDDFLDEFQRRQRSQALSGSSTKLFFERMTTYVSGFGRAKWVVGAVGAYACVMLFFLVKPTVSPMGQQPASGGARPVDAKMMKPSPDKPVYDPKVNRIRPLRTEVREVIVF